MYVTTHGEDNIFYKVFTFELSLVQMLSDENSVLFNK